MSDRNIIQKPIFFQSWLSLIVIVLCLGIFFRIVNLDRKVFWVDEAATALRISGFTKLEMIQNISTQTEIDVADLQKYQHPVPDRGFKEVMVALIQSPEHAPLYFVLARVWVEQWGSSVATLRSLSVIFSLIGLPCIYGLAWELFQSRSTAAIAMLLLAVSPFHTAYAQEARPYSLWTVTILISGWILLRSMRFCHIKNWSFYAVSLVVGLYTSLLTLFVAVGQGLSVLVVENFCVTKRFKFYFITLGIAIAAFIPWLWVMLENSDRLQDNVVWMRSPLPIGVMIAIWLYSIVIIFVDFPVYLSFDFVIATAVLTDVTLLIIVGFSVYFLCVKTPKRVWSFVLALAATPLFLLLVDLLTGGQASATPRYSIPLHLGILLSVAHLLSVKIQTKIGSQQKIWSIAIAAILSISICFCIVNVETSPTYQKDRNIHNPAIAALVNQSEMPLLLTESKQAMDLLSLSHLLAPKVKIQIVSGAGFSADLTSGQDVFLLSPSKILLDTLETQQRQTKKIYQPRLLTPDDAHLSLWSVSPKWVRSS